MARETERDGVNRRALSFSLLTAVRTRVASKKARAGGATPAPSREGEKRRVFRALQIERESELQLSSGNLPYSVLSKLPRGDYYDNPPNE